MRSTHSFSLFLAVLLCTAGVVHAGKVVVAMNPLSVSENTEIEGGAVSMILQAELSASKELTLVDRRDMERALKELKLSQQGMIDPASTRALSKIVGAEYFFSGNINKVGAKVMLTARVIEIETTLVKMAYTFIESGDDVQAAGKKLAQQVQDIVHTFESEKAADAAAKPVSKSTEKAIPKEWKRPTVMVVIPEMHIRQPQLIDPAGETEIVKRLIDAGFNVTDSEYLTLMKRKQANAKEIFGSPRTATAFAAEKGVDVLLYGEAISERGATLNDFVSCSGRIELKAIAVKNDEILAADSAEGGATDLAETVAGKKAIKQAANKLADTFIYTVAEKWNKK